jgi:hypothetical protein
MYASATGTNLLGPAAAAAPSGVVERLGPGEDSAELLGHDDPATSFLGCDRHNKIPWGPSSSGGRSLGPVSVNLARDGHSLGVGAFNLAYAADYCAPPPDRVPGRAAAPASRDRRCCGTTAVPSHRTWPGSTPLTCGGPDWLRRRPAGRLTESGPRWPFSRRRLTQSGPRPMAAISARRGRSSPSLAGAPIGDRVARRTARTDRAAPDPASGRAG